MKKEVKNIYHPERISKAVKCSGKSRSKLCTDILFAPTKSSVICQNCAFNQCCLHHLGCEENSISHYSGKQPPRRWTVLFPLARAVNKDVRCFFDPSFDGPFNEAVSCVNDLTERFRKKLNSITPKGKTNFDHYEEVCGISHATALRNYNEGINSISVFLIHLTKLGIDITELLE